MKIIIDIDTQKYDRYINEGASVVEADTAFMYFTVNDIGYDIPIVYPLFITNEGHWYVSTNSMLDGEISGYDVPLRDIFKDNVIDQVINFYNAIKPAIAAKSSILDIVEAIRVARTDIKMEIGSLVEDTQAFLTYIRENNVVVYSENDWLGTIYTFLLKGVKIPFPLDFLKESAAETKNYVPALTAYVLFDTNIQPLTPFTDSIAPYIDAAEERIVINIQEDDASKRGFKNVTIYDVRLDLYTPVGDVAYENIPLTFDMREALMKAITPHYKRVEGHCVGTFVKYAYDGANGDKANL